MAAITQEQGNILTKMGQQATKIRQGNLGLQDQMKRYIAAGYSTPTDEELAAANFDYTAAQILLAVDSAEELDNLFDDNVVIQGPHGANLDRIRKG